MSDRDVMKILTLFPAEYSFEHSQNVIENLSDEVLISNNVVFTKLIHSLFCCYCFENLKISGRMSQNM